LQVSLHSQAVFESVSDPPGARWQGFFGVRSNGAAGWCTTGLNRREQKRLSHGAFVTLIALLMPAPKKPSELGRRVSPAD
jgi:hypothetical protein